MEILLWLFCFILFFMLIDTRSKIKDLQRQLDNLIVKVVLGRTYSDKPREKPVPIEKIEEKQGIDHVEIKQEKPIIKSSFPSTSPALPSSSSLFKKTEKGLTFLGQKLIVWIAGFAAVLGFFYFVRYSIENGLLTPADRLLVAAICGGLSILAGCWLHRRKQTANHLQISEVLTGVGIAAWYFTSYALSKMYALAPEYVSVILMICVTIISVVLTLYYGGKTSAVLALIGGFLTPMLSVHLYRGSAFFCTYMFLLILGMMLISRRLVSAWLAIVSLIALYFWIGIYMYSYLLPSDELCLFVLLAATTLIIMFGMKNSALENKFPFRIVTFAVMAFYTFSFLFKSNFGLQEWILIAVLSAGLSLLTIARRQTYFTLLTSVNVIAYILLFMFVDQSSHPSLIMSLFAVITLLPLYVASWFKSYKEFILFSPCAAPLVYAVTYAVLPETNILPYIGLISAALLLLRIIKLNLKDEKISAYAGVIILCSAVLIAFALASLLDVKLWASVLAFGTLLLAVLKQKLKIQNLTNGMTVGLIGFVLLQKDIIALALDLLLLAPINGTIFSLDELSSQFYIVDILIPVASFVGVGYLLNKEILGKISAVLAGLLGFYGLYSLYPLLKMTTRNIPVISVDYIDSLPITLILLTGCLIYLSNHKDYLFAKVAFFIGIYRLVYIDIINMYLDLSYEEVSFLHISVMYGYPMLLFMLLAWKGRDKTRDIFTLGAAAMSFVYVSAMLLYFFYGTLRLEKIDFTDISIFAFSVAWLVLGGMWLVVAFRKRVLVKPAFGLIYLVIAKVFLYDVASLAGIWRIIALFGLAGSLLAISYFYSRYFEIKKEGTV